LKESLVRLPCILTLAKFVEWWQALFEYRRYWHLYCLAFNSFWSND